MLKDARTTPALKEARYSARNERGEQEVVWQKADNMEECIEIGANIESGQ